MGYRRSIFQQADLSVNILRVSPSGPFSTLLLCCVCFLSFSCILLLCEVLAGTNPSVRGLFLDLILIICCIKSASFVVAYSRMREQPELLRKTQRGALDWSQEKISFVFQTQHWRCLRRTSQGQELHRNHLDTNRLWRKVCKGSSGSVCSNTTMMVPIYLGASVFCESLKLR